MVGRSYMLPPFNSKRCTRETREAQLQLWLPDGWTVTVREIPEGQPEIKRKKTDAKKNRNRKPRFRYEFHPPAALAALMRIKYKGNVPVVRQGAAIENFIAEARDFEDARTASGGALAASPQDAQLDNEEPEPQVEEGMQSRGNCVNQFLHPALNTLVAEVNEVRDVMAKIDRPETQALGRLIESCCEKITDETINKDICFIGMNGTGKSFLLNLFIMRNIMSAYEYAEAGSILPKLLDRYKGCEGLAAIAVNYAAAAGESYSDINYHVNSARTVDELINILNTKGPRILNPLKSALHILNPLKSAVHISNPLKSDVHF